MYALIYIINDHFIKIKLIKSFQTKQTFQVMPWVSELVLGWEGEHRKISTYILWGRG